MEYRKLINFGKTSYVVSLPKKWITKNELKKGDVIGLEETESSLILTPNVENAEKKIKSIEMDITGIDRTSILYVIRSAYKMGCDEIKLKFDKSVAQHYRKDKDVKVLSVIHEEVNRLVGIEVIQQRENFCIIKDLSESSIKEFENIMRKVFLILSDASSDLIDAIKKNDKILIETIEEKHNSVTKFISYCLRLLNKRKDGVKDILYYHILSNLDKIMDVIKYIAREIKQRKHKLKKETVEIIKNIDYSIKKYHEMFFKFDYSKVSELYENRDKVIKEIENLVIKDHPRGELVILEKAESILEIITDITEARMGLEI